MYTTPMDPPSEDAIRRIRACTGKRPTAWHRPIGGYTRMERWIVRFDDGSSAFAKIATDKHHSDWLRAEWHVYRHVFGPFMAEVLGWEDADHPLLLLEDLHRAHWPPPWTAKHIDTLLDTLASLHRSPIPPGLKRVESMGAELKLWAEVAKAPSEFLSLGLCSEEWLATALPDLLAAEAAVRLAGEDLLHLDVRSDNLCFDGEHGQRCVLVDWNWACVGNAEVDVAFWLPSLHAEGGPPPEEILPDAPEMAALVCGYYARYAGQPAWPGGEPVRALQRRCLRSALTWAARALDLPAPQES